MMIPTAQKHSLRAAIQGLHGEVLQEIAIDQAGCPPVVAGELTNIAGDPVSGETAEYLIRPGKLQCIFVMSPRLRKLGNLHFQLKVTPYSYYEHCPSRTRVRKQT